MTLTAQLIHMAVSDPAVLRALLQDESVVNTLRSIGVRSAVLQLHAPLAARDGSGFGKTLCKISATRHALVTCKKCLHEQDKLTGARPIAARATNLPWARRPVQVVAVA